MFHKFLRYLLCACVALSLQAWGQSCGTFDFTTTTTPSTCQANGSIAVEITTNKADFYDYTYQIVAADGRLLQNTSTPSLGDLARGNHKVRVVAKCRADDEEKFVEKIIEVTGDYVVPNVAFNSLKSVGSYTSCLSGRIVFDVRGGKAPYTYTITAAPSGVTVPQVVTPEAMGESLRLPGDNWPSGNYTIHWKDNCDYQADLTFNLPVRSALPVPQNAPTSYPGAKSSLLLPTGGYGNVCDGVVFNLTMDKKNANYNGWKALIDANLIQVGLAEVGQEVAADKWVTYQDTSQLVVPLPNTYEYHRASGSHADLQFVIRNTECPSEIIRYAATKYINDFKLTNVQYVSGGECGTYAIRHIIDVGANQQYACFPLTIKVHTGSKTGSVSGTYIIDGHNKVVISTPLTVSTIHFLEILNKDGQTIAWHQQAGRTLTLASHSHIPLLGCNKYLYAFKDQGAACYPMTFIIDDVTSSPYKIIKQYTLDTYEDVFQFTPELEYGKKYRVRALDANNVQRGVGYVQQAAMPAYNFNLSFDPDENLPGQATMKVEETTANTMIRRRGTRITVRGPEGFETWTNVLTAEYAYSKGIPSFKQYAPAGDYEVAISYDFDPECGEKVYKFHYPGGYTAKDLSYQQVAGDCDLSVMMDGMIMLGGEDRPDLTYFRVLEGVGTSYEHSAVLKGNPLPLRAPGRYLIGIQVGGNIETPALDSIYVSVVKDPLSLDVARSLAYICRSGAVETGQILVKAQGGIPPYTYELYNADNTEAVKKATGEPYVLSNLAGNVVAHFSHGAANEVYTIRMKDNCNTAFTTQLTIQKPENIRLISTPAKAYCIGEDVILTSNYEGVYHWTGPNGFESSERTVVLPKATKSVSGTYYLSVTPSGCGDAIEASLPVLVEACWAPVNPNLMHKVEQK